jgi:phage-related tail fiber protein
MTTQDRLSGGASLPWKAPVRVATTANVTLSGLQTVDGVLLVDGERVLVKSQTAGAENGIWIAHSTTWTRAPDWDGTGDVTDGTFVFVSAGTTYENTVWNVTTSGTIVIGTTSVAFQQFSTLTAAIATQAEVNAGTSAAVLVTPSTLNGRVTFSAHKNGTDQTGVVSAVATKVTFGTEEWDVGPFFASSTFSPTGAGKYILIAAVRWNSTNAVDNEQLELTIYKNGAAYKSNIFPRAGTGFQSTFVTAVVDNDGNDTFEVYVTKYGAGNGEIQGLAALTYFQGYKL